MAIKLLDIVDFTRIPSNGFIVPIVDYDPDNYEAGLIYNRTSQQLKYSDGTSWVALGTFGAGAPPTGAASGDLTGQYPAPQIAPQTIRDADVYDYAYIKRSKIEGLELALEDLVPEHRQVIAGIGLTGGGPLSSDVILNVDVLTLAGTWVRTIGDTMTGDLDMSGNKVLQLPDTGFFNELDAAPIWYVNQRASGMRPIQECRVATVSPITLAGLQVIDGVQLAAGDRVLVRYQHSGSITKGSAVANGVYVASVGPWARTQDTNEEGELESGTVLAVTDGTTYKGITFSCQIPKAQVPYEPGFTDNYWMIFTSRVVINAGAGLVMTGNTIDVVPADGTLVATPDTLRVAHAPKWTTARTIALTGHVLGTSPPIDGSTNTPSWATTIANGVITNDHISATAEIDMSKISGLSSAIVGMVPGTRKVTAGNGLTGGGTLEQDIALNVYPSDTSLTVVPDGISVAHAPKWTTPRRLTLTGGVEGTVLWDGSANVTMATTLAVGGPTSLVRQFSQLVAGGITVPVIHGLKTRNVQVQVYRTTSPYDTVDCGVERTDIDTVTLKFATAVAANAYTVVVQGGV